MNHRVDRCPDLETIAAYLDRRLPERERGRIAEHIASCETCYFAFTEAAQIRVNEPAAGKTAEAVEGGDGRAWWSAPRVLWTAGRALAAAASVALMIGTGWLTLWPAGGASELQGLVAAVGTDRSIEPRLTGGFAYGPVRGPVRAGEPSMATASPDVRIAAARIEQDVARHRTPQSLRSLGLAYLVMGDVNRAVPALEEAADQPAPDAQVLSDLSAAYLTRAVRNGQPQDFVTGLAMADRAVKADPRLGEAWFNRAYALERLSMADEARQAWQDYLKIDDRSGWAEEARSRLKTPAGPQSGLIDEGRRTIELAASRQQDAPAISGIVERSPRAVRERLSLVREAWDAWRDYPTIDGRSGWAGAS
jgi:tetratricopeptide (TPR) repeat protein